MDKLGIEISNAYFGTEIDTDGKKDGEEVIIQRSYTLPRYLNGNRTDDNYVYYYVSTDPLQVDDYNNYKIGTEETPINENAKNTMQESQEVYNSESYKSIGDFFDKQDIITRAELTYMGGPFLGMINASRHLKWFLEGYMDQFHLNMHQLMRMI